MTSTTRKLALRASAIGLSAVAVITFFGASTATAADVDSGHRPAVAPMGPPCSTALNGAAGFLRELGENPPPTTRDAILADLFWWASNYTGTIRQEAEHWITEIDWYC